MSLTTLGAWAGAPPVSFANDIQPIFKARCAWSHDADHFRELDLTEGRTFANLVNQPTSAACMKIVPGSQLRQKPRPRSSRARSS